MKPTKSAQVARSAAAGSWLALLAATTLGDAANTLRAEVRADELPAGAGVYRLVIQSYDRSYGPVPGPESRPVGSTQRAVTAEELRQGVQVELLELRAGVQPNGESARPLVVAWIERVDADLEFDGRRARPGPGSVYGVVPRDATGGAVQISLDRTVA